MKYDFALPSIFIHFLTLSKKAGQFWSDSLIAKLLYNKAANFLYACNETNVLVKHTNTNNKDKTEFDRTELTNMHNATSVGKIEKRILPLDIELFEPFEFNVSAQSDH